MRKLMGMEKMRYSNLEHVDILVYRGSRVIDADISIITSTI